MAYVVVEISINDPAKYERYKALAPASIAKFGGTYLVRGGTTEALEGTWDPERFVILQFPTADAARSWWHSPEYSAARAIRQTCAEARMLLVDGPPFDPSKA